MQFNYRKNWVSLLVNQDPAFTRETLQHVFEPELPAAPKISYRDVVLRGDAATAARAGSVRKLCHGMGDFTL